jgi:uncharacterized RDD family membrane protein YckC
MANTEKARRRAFITPDSFSVAPDLLGLPLARPMRRGGAMLIDLVGIALLARAGVLFLAIAAALTLWRASRGQSQPRRRTALRITAIALPIGMLAWCDNPFNRDSDDEPSPGNVMVRNGEWAQLAAIPDLITLETSQDSAEVARAARNLAERLTSSEMDTDARLEIREDLLDELDSPAARAVLRNALDTLGGGGADEAVRDSAVLHYADAVARGEVSAADSLRPAARDALAGERIQKLEQREDDLEDEIQNLQEQRTGFTGFIRNIADDLGIGFGWGALYFTAFLTLWRGQTPGKRVFGVRVIRLDGRPLGWWYSFERFGGYAASLSTGLLGFLQILWDANRQGLHDKAVETVVIRDLPPSLAAGEGWQRVGR